MLYAALIFALILILPIAINVCAAFDGECKKLYFAIFLFGKIKILCGYFKPCGSDGGYLHFKKKAYYLKYSYLFKMKKSPVTISAFTVTNVETNAYFGLKSFAAIYFLSALYGLVQTLSRVIAAKRKEINIKNNLYIEAGGAAFTVNANVGIKFCLLAIIVNVVENFIKKVGKNEKKRKQNCGSN